jgi:molecular chaperone HtpG
MTEPSRENPPAAEPPATAVELPFQAEVSEVLSLVINSLYTHREVFLRELVSNAADALDKARYLGLTQKDVTSQEGEPLIAIRLDEEAGTLTIEDNGVGMTRDELIQNLGTIARSGSREFLKAHSAESPKDQALQLIGQFGVGFYAAFMVAARIDVKTLSMLPGAMPVVWRSTGAGSFTVLAGERTTPGTEIVVHLKEDASEFAKPWRVREIIRKYSDFVSVKITIDGELANTSKALWALPKSQVTEDQYTEFYRHLTGTGESPLARVHTSVDAPVQYNALLYVPEKAPFDLFHKEHRGVRLYAKRVLILEDCDKLVPSYLRFLRGVVDSEDLSLNVSREMLQSDKTLASIEQQLTKQILKALRELADSDAERYASFWREFGRVLKEGLAVDMKNKDALAELCRFDAMSASAEQPISLRAYVDAMPEGQKDIYYVTGASRRAIENSPHLEALKKRGYDVLFLTDPIDEWLTQALTEFDGHALKSITHGEVDLGDVPDEESDKAKKDDAHAAAAVAAVKSALGDKVKDVRLSRRLTDSASCLVAAEGDLGANLERIMKMIDKNATESTRILELNAAHPIVQNLSTLAEREPASPKVQAWSELLLDQALLAEGVVQDPAELVKRLQAVLVDASSAALKG